MTMCSHVPNRGEQMVRYYGWYSNVTRGKRLKRAEHDAVPYIIESDRSPAACRKSWGRLIQKIYEVDPLICPKCLGTMRIISSIEDRKVIKTILKHLGLWLIRSRPFGKGSCATGACLHCGRLLSCRLSRSRRLRRSRLPLGRLHNDIRPM